MCWQRLIYNKKNRQQFIDKLNIATVVLMACTILIKMCTITVLAYKIYYYEENPVNVSLNKTV